MNSHEKFPAEPAVVGWQWQPPQYRLALKSYSSQAWAFMLRWRKTSSITAAMLVLGIIVFRYEVHWAALKVSIYADAILATALTYALCVYVLRRWFTERHVLRQVMSIIGVAFALVVMWKGAGVHQYLGQYWRYHTLDLVELQMMPITEHERVLSLNGIHTLAKRLRDQTESVTKPTFIKTKDGFCWSMAVEPDRPWQQIWDPVSEVLCVPHDEATPDLSHRGQIPAHFEFGENLWFSRNLETCTLRSLSPWRFFSYEPEQPFVAQKDDGTWVWIVPWIKWHGTLLFLFPRPEFGGVQIIEQSPEHPFYRRWFWEVPKRVLFGCGTWVPPEDVHKYAFLRGQNIMPDSVSRTFAESFRFQESILGPWRFFKAGDIRIADNEGDVNRQPYSSYYRMPIGNGTKDKLYDSFALEPNDKSKTTLVTSVFVPGDGIGPTLVYRHSKHNEAPLGVTWVESQVRADRGDAFWADRRVEEHRYYIRDLADSKGRVKRRLMYLSIVVLVEKQKDEHSVAEVTLGSSPPIAITDSDTRLVVWVDPHHPEEWDAKVREKFGLEWAKRAK